MSLRWPGSGWIPTKVTGGTDERDRWMSADAWCSNSTLIGHDDQTRVIHRRPPARPYRWRAVACGEPVFDARDSQFSFFSHRFALEGDLVCDARCGRGSRRPGWGRPGRSCQGLTGSWLVIRVERVPTRSSSSSSRSLRSAALMGEIAKSSMTRRSRLASCVRRRAKLPSP